MGKDNHIIEINHLSKSYGDVDVLKDINLYINKGEFITFLGPSGCGKSTFLKTLNRMNDLVENDLVAAQTEVDIFALTVINKGKQYGIKTPYCNKIYEIIFLY